MGTGSPVPTRWIDVVPTLSKVYPRSVGAKNRKSLLGICAVLQKKKRGRKRGRKKFKIKIKIVMRVHIILFPLPFCLHLD